MSTIHAQCNSCQHASVCKFKDEYMDALQAVTNATVNKEAGDGKISFKYIRDIPWVEPSLVCKHYYGSPYNNADWEYLNSTGTSNTAIRAPEFMKEGTYADAQLHG